MERMQKSEQPDDQLSSLMTAYRESFPEVDASPQFMPNLWKRIEARRQETTSIFKRLVQVCVAATAVAVVVLSIAMPRVSPADNDTFFSATYTEVLAADHADRAYVAVLPADLPDGAGVAR